jgi:uncharacterized protein
MTKKEKIRIKLWDETFSIAKAKKAVPKAFAVIKDNNETTVVIKTSQVKNKEFLQIENGWKLITFDTVFSFSTIGFIAKISQALAKAKISIFVISSFSTDHILVKETDFPKTLLTLKKLGFTVKS